MDLLFSHIQEKKETLKAAKKERNLKRKKAKIKLKNSSIIYHKLEQFVKKYYTNELLRGSIFFIGIGLLY